MKFLRITFSICSILTYCGSVFGQLQPFWSEDFSDGDIPAGWKNEETASGKNCLWTWCADPAMSDVGGCPDIWNTPANQQKPFAATTAKTGFVTMDSDDYGELGTDHDSKLTTSAINCTGKNEVWITFQTHIGVYTYPADANAVLRVSTDGSNWTEFQVFDGLTTTVRWSDNPEYPIINISSVAAGQSQVFIQWKWVGNWDYHWSIDDVELYEKDPTPLNDLAITEFFYPASSYATPESQISTDTFGFYARVSNLGLESQGDVKLTVKVENPIGGGFLLHSDEITVGTAGLSMEDSLFEFPKIYIPKLVEGRYRITYSVGNASTDGRPANNVFSRDFLVTQNHFAKEEKPEQGYRPSELTDVWTVNNFYQMSPGVLEKYKVVEAEFAFTTNEDEVAPGEVEATVYLLKVNADIAEDFSNLDDDNLFNNVEILGIAEYQAPDDLVDTFQVQKVALNDLNTGTSGVQLVAGERYFLSVSYSDPYNQVFHAFNDDVSYYFTSTLIYTDEWSTFGDDVNAVARMNLALVVTTDEKPLPAEALQVFPNPANDLANLQINFKHPTDATITIAQLDGRVVSILEKTGLTQEKIEVPTTKMASGSYLARIATRDGTRTVKFVVNH